MITLTLAISDSLKTFSDPIWTAAEVEKFWAVIEPYLTQLLNGSVPLPEHNMEFMNLDPRSAKDWKRCVECLHEGIWRGRYSETVANLKAVRLFFKFNKNRNITNNKCDVQCARSEELKELRNIFFERSMRKHVLITSSSCHLV